MRSVLGLFAAMLLPLSGCTSVTVTRVVPDEQTIETAWHFWLNPFNVWNEVRHRNPAEHDANARGIRFFLPKPYILVTPNATGGIDVERVFLPDLSQEYAVESRVYVASQNFAVTLAEGVLQKISYKPDQTAVLSRLIEAGGNVGAEVIAKKAEVSKAEAEAAAKEREEAAKLQKEHVTALLKAEAELADLRFAVQQAEKALRDYEAIYPDPDAAQKLKIAELKAAVRKAEHDVAVKEAEVARLQDLLGVVRTALTDAPPENNIVNVPGPALFEIVECRPSKTCANPLALRAVQFELGSTEAVQAEVRTYRPKVVQETKPPLDFVSAPTAPISPVGSTYSVDFVFNRSLETGKLTVQVLSMTDPPRNVPLQQGPPTPQTPMSSYFIVNGEKLVLVLAAKDAGAGKYRLRIVSEGSPNESTFELR